jgi:O-antigen/teichoic acid export membrane protein
VRLIKEYISNNGGTFRAAVKTTISPLIKSDFIQKVGETFATRILLIGIGLVTSVLVARILGPEGRGLYAVAMAVGAIGVQVGNLGLHASNTYYVARERSLLPSLIGNSLLVSFVFGGVGTVLAWIVFSLRPELAPIHGLLLELSLLWIPFGLAYLLLLNLLLGIQEVRAYNKIELNNQLLSVVLTGLVILGGIVSVETVFVAGFIALVAGFSLALWGLKKHAKDIRLPSFSLIRDNIHYGIKAYLAAFFSFLVLRIDLLMVKYMLGAEQTGYYSIAVTMADLVNMLPVVVATILFPKICAIDSVAEKWLMTKKVTIVTSVILVSLCGLAVIVARPLVHILYGKSFLPSVPAFVWLMPGIFFLGAQVIAVQFLNSVGFPKVVVAVWGCCAFLNVLFNLWAIPEYGIVGASFVSSISYFMVFIFVVLIIRKNLSIYAI